MSDVKVAPLDAELGAAAPKADSETPSSVDDFFLGLPASNLLRRKAYDLCNHKVFDNFILLVIIANTAIMGIADYSSIVETGSASELGELLTDGSTANTILAVTEYIFTPLYAAEAILKIMGWGWFGYWSDAWNKMDFTVTIAGIVTLAMPGAPGLGFLRLFRVLKPLRTLNKAKGMKMLVTSMLASLPGLVNVILLLVFAFFVFGIISVQMFHGIMHNRCRLTPYPVTKAWDVGLPFEDFQCKPGGEVVINFSTLDEKADWGMSDSPWATPQDCFWPIDEDDGSVCGYVKDARHQCWNDENGGAARIAPEDWRWCGSNFDAKGNERFTGGEVAMYNRTFTTEKLMRMGTWSEDTNWGYTGFDHTGAAFVSIFQSITLEGWTDIMYACMDSQGEAIAILFCLMVLLASLFVLNLLLAVMEEEFSEQREKQEAADEAEKEAALLMSPTKVAPVDGAKAFSVRGAIGAAVGGLFPGDGPVKTEGYGAWRLKLLAFVEHKYFEYTVLTLIGINTCVLGSDHHPMDDSMGYNLEIASFLLTICFTGEMLLKCIAMGIPKYLSTIANAFDAFIVSASLIELVLAPPEFIAGVRSEAGAISALRCFRLFRLFKLAKNWTSMNVLLGKVLRTLYDVVNIALLLVLFMYIFALLGMQLFANRMKFDGDGYVIPIGSEGWDEAMSPRANFDDLTFAFTTIFQVLSGENWNAVMYDCRRATGAIGLTYFIILVILGLFIMMSLFLAILLSNFGDDDEEEEEVHEEAVADEPEMSSTVANIFKNQAELSRIKVRNVQAKLIGNLTDPFTNDKQVKTDVVTTPRETVFPLNEKRAFFIFGATNPLRVAAARLVDWVWFDRLILTLICISSLLLAIDSPLDDPKSAKVELISYCDSIFTAIFLVEMGAKLLALGLFFQEGAYFRNAWNVLDGGVVIISVYSITTAQAGLASLRSLRALRALRPLRMVNRAPGLKLVVNSVIAVVPDAVNVLLICALFFLMFGIIGVQYFKGTFFACSHESLFPDIAGKAFPGTMTPLEQFVVQPKKWIDMDAVEKSWFKSTSPFAEFGGLDLEGCGADAPCCLFDVSEVAKTQDGPTSREVCKCLGGDWDPVISQSFNNIGKAMLTLFEISTTEAWVDVMLASVDATGVDMQPIRDQNPGWVWFFITYMIVSAFFFMNLFVGVLYDKFMEMKKKYEVEGRTVFLSRSQTEWLRAQVVAMKYAPDRIWRRPSETPWRAKCYDFVTRPWFDNFIMACIGLNTLVMAAQYFGQNDLYSLILDSANLVFAIIFTLEAVIKIGAFNKGYFSDAWNKFDFVIVLGTAAAFVITATGLAGGSGGVVSVVRAFRLGRIVRMVKGAEKLRELITTLIVTLYGLMNVGILLVLLFFIYSVLAVQLFALVEYNGDYSEHGNFRTFWGAMLTLFRFSTGENWNGFMHDMTIPMDGCVAVPEYDDQMCGFNDEPGCIPLNGCGTVDAFPFLTSFTLVVTFIAINLFISIILDGHSSQSNMLVGQAEFEHFLKLWRKYDPDADQYISVKDLRDMLHELPAPWGYAGEEVSSKVVNAEISSFKVYTEGIHYQQVFFSLTTKVVEFRMREAFDEDDDLNLDIDPAQVRDLRRIQNKTAKSARRVDRIADTNGREWTMVEYHAAEILRDSLMEIRSRKAGGKDGKAAAGASGTAEAGKWEGGSGVTDGPPPATETQPAEAV